MNSWRMTALGLPPPVSSTDGLNASAELAASIGLTIEECKRIYALNKKWLELEVSEKKWIEAVSNQIASLKKNKVALARVKKLQTAIADKKRKKASVGRR